MKHTRREFAFMGAGTILATSLHMTVAEASTGVGTATAAQNPAVSNTPWYRRIKRIGQTNFNEKDPVYGNVEEWADYWGKTKVDAVALSVSGPVAFYPTDVPYFHRSKYLNGRDLFGECVAAAKKRGIRVYGRMSPDIQYTESALLAAHPLWLRRNEDGSLQYSAPDIAFTCHFSGQFTEQQPAIIRELNKRYDIDGIYMNGWPNLQVCYCQTCRTIGDPHSPEYRIAFMRRAEELINLYKKICLEKSPNNFYSCNLGGGLQESGLDQWRLTRDALWYTADNQSRSSVVAPVWQDSQQVKFAHALMGGKPVAAVTASYTRSGRIMWRQVSDTTAEVECRMAQTAAAGGIVWYHWLGLEQGFKNDRRWQQPGIDFLSWHAKHDRHFHNVRSLSKVAIVASSRSMALYKAPEGGDKTDSLEGMYAALTAARIPFDFVHDEDLGEARLGQYTAVILPNVALLSDAQAAQLKQYAAGGGSILATFETGLYDETGKARHDFALASLFGIEKAGSRKKAEKQLGPMDEVNLLSIKMRNALTAGFEETDWIAGPVWSVPLAPVASAVMTYINPYPVYPPESVYQREDPSGVPSVVMSQKGNSRFVYLAGDMEATFWRTDNPDLERLLVNSVRWVMNEAGVRVAGEGMAEVFAWETEPGFALHMVNYNGPNALRGRMRKPLPLGPQKVRMELPRDVTIKSAALLRAETPLQVQQRGRIVEFTIPAVNLYEVVVLEV